MCIVLRTSKSTMFSYTLAKKTTPTGMKKLSEPRKENVSTLTSAPAANSEKKNDVVKEIHIINVVKKQTIEPSNVRFSSKM